METISANIGASILVTIQPESDVDNFRAVVIVEETSVSAGMEIDDLVSSSWNMIRLSGSLRLRR
jgi:hypothetical protein